MGGPICAAVVLTGGASRRMGRTKATIEAGGEPLAVRTARLLAASCHPVVELGPGHAAAAGVPNLTDTGGGPLAALAGAGALWATLPADGHVVVAATDLPRLTPGAVTWLASHPALGTVVPVDSDGRPQWLFARYPVDALLALAAAPTGGRLGAWAERLAPLLVAPDGWVGAAGDASALADVDTPGDLRRVGG